MSLKLVYRSLREISQWTLDGFYSEVYVSGEENVPADGPLIVTPCHHNEIIDIATLAVTMPHRRPVCFWAKSSMFANPIARAVMTSSGSIPVRRNPNNVANSNGKNEAGSESHLALFRETFHALDREEVIGVFPEGTSYTEPQIAQVKEGAAWAALEYARWQIQYAPEYTDGALKKLMIVPVGIVYSDKSRFQSRVLVQYGEPIDVEPYARRHLASNVPRAEVKKLTAEIETRLLKLTINAKDWDVSFAAIVARQILYPEIQPLPLKDYRGVSQELIERVSLERDPEALSTLVKYSGLLHYTGISHNSLATLYPTSGNLSRAVKLSTFLHQTIATVLHPRFLCFLPVGLLHIPAYIAGLLAGRFLANPKEPETVAEHKAVCGGLAFGATSAIVGKAIAGALYDIASARWKAGHFNWATKTCAWLFTEPQDLATAAIIRSFGTVAVMYWTTRLLFRWHKALIGWNYQQYQLLTTAWKVLLWTCLSSRVLSSTELDHVNRPPLPKPNQYIKRRDAVAPSMSPNASAETAVAIVPSPRALIGHLLVARVDAEATVHKLFDDRR